MMKSYIVNLLKDKDRKLHMSEIMANYTFLIPEFIEAVYGKLLSENELNTRFNQSLAYKRYGRNLNLGEIGCTLSHFKCYHELLDGDDPHVLILEDDITILGDLSSLEKAVESLPNDLPWVLLLSGDYWFKKMTPIDGNFSIASVYDAVGTYAYIINRKGAELILQKNPKASSVADNWSLYRAQGLRLYAVYPYIIDANIEDFGSSIEQFYFGEVRKNMPLLFRLKSYKLSLVKKWLVKKGHFVSKIRK